MNTYIKCNNIKCKNNGLNNVCNCCIIELKLIETSDVLFNCKSFEKIEMEIGNSIYEETFKYDGRN